MNLQPAAPHRISNTMAALVKIALFAGLGGWFIACFSYALNADHAWLIESARRLLDGQRMADAYFDPNPPLSIMLYAPVVWLEKTAILRPPYTHYGFTSIITIISAFWVYRLLRRNGFDAGFSTLQVFCFLVTCTILTLNKQLDFGERDQFIYIGLIIFMLSQMMITNQGRQSVNAYDFVFMGIAVIFILLKPHYLILPAIMGLHRLYKSRAISSILYAPDFHIGLVITVGYMAVLAIFFEDYLTEIFPLFRDIYLQVFDPNIMRITFIYASLLVCAVIMCCLSEIERDRLRAILALYALSALCLILFYIQGKGIYYQIIPALGFMTMGFGAFSYSVIEALLQRNQSTRQFQIFAAPLSMIIVMCGAFMLKPTTNAITHRDYERTHLAQYINQCAPDCSFFMFSRDMEVIHQLAYYTGAKHASRFPVLWWLPDALQNPDSARAQKMHAAMIEDIQRDQPEYLFLIANLHINGQNFDIPRYIAQTQSGRDLMARYEKIQTHHDTLEHYIGPLHTENPTVLIFDIYHKKHN